MKNLIVVLFLASAALLCSAVPALAAEIYSPVSVDSYTMGSFDTLCIQKVYQLSPSDDPSGIPTDDFVERGMLYHLSELTSADNEGPDCKTVTYTAVFTGTEMPKVSKDIQDMNPLVVIGIWCGTAALAATAPHRPYERRKI